MIVQVADEPSKERKIPVIQVMIEQSVCKLDLGALAVSAGPNEQALDHNLVLFECLNAAARSKTSNIWSLKYEVFFHLPFHGYTVPIKIAYSNITIAGLTRTNVRNTMLKTEATVLFRNV